MEITRNELDTTPGSGDWFTGGVFIDTVAVPTGSSRIAAACVHFTPGARTAWHTHPYGQTIWVDRGRRPLPAARRSDRGDPARRPRLLRAGRGPLARATPTRLMVHVAMQQADDDGSVVTWGEHVTEEEYGATISSDTAR